MGRSGTRVVDESRTTYTVTGLGQDEFNAVVEFAYNAGVNISTWGHGSSKFGYSYTVEHPKPPKPTENERLAARGLVSASCFMCTRFDPCADCLEEPSKRPYDGTLDFAKNVSASICGMYSDAEVKTARARMHQAENEAIASALRRYADSLDRRGAL
jgi:MoaA/NifB/PqqE/SkfB family radical SAM enzyme